MEKLNRQTSVVQCCLAYQDKFQLFQIKRMTGSSLLLSTLFCMFLNSWSSKEEITDLRLQILKKLRYCVNGETKQENLKFILINAFDVTNARERQINRCNNLNLSNSQRLSLFVSLFHDMKNITCSKQLQRKIGEQAKYTHRARLGRHATRAERRWLIFEAPLRVECHKSPTSARLLCSFGCLSSK